MIALVILLTGFLVIVASRFGMPVSTTHVSVGSLFGIGFSTGGANLKMIRQILLAWVITLPIVAVIGSLSFIAFNSFFGIN